MSKEKVITYKETIKRFGQKIFYTKSSITIYNNTKRKNKTRSNDISKLML